MKVVVTGGSGCIGSELVKELLKKGHSVTVLDNMSSGKEEHIAELRRNKNFEFVEGDVLDRELMDRIMVGKEMVFHLAANPDIKFTHGDRTDKDLQQNTVATYNVLDAMQRNGVKKIAFSSSSV